MEPRNIAQQMIVFQKTAFDGSFQALSLFQEQTEKMLDMVLNQASWLPEGNKKFFFDWMSSYKKGCEGFKQAVDESFNKAAEYFAEAR